MSLIVRPRHDFAVRGSPRDFSGLRVWWEAAHIQGVADGGTVSVIPDVGGLGFDATSVGPTAGVFKTAQLNGLPAVRFTPVGAGGTVGGVAFQSAGSCWSGTKPLTVVVVVRPSNIGVTNAQIFSIPNGFRLGWESVGGKIATTVTGVATYLSSSSGFAVNVPRVVAWTYDHTPKRANDYFDGAQGYLDTSRVVGTPGGGTGPWVLGSQDVVFQNNLSFYGDWFALMAWDRVLQPWELRAVMTMYAKKYAITAPAAWTPVADAGVSCWLTAKSIRGLADLAAMSRWEDMARDNHAVPLLAPRYRKSVFGKPAVEFWNPDEAVAANAFTLPTGVIGATGGSVFIAHRSFEPRTVLKGRALFGRSRVSVPGTYVDLRLQSGGGSSDLVVGYMRYNVYDIAQYDPSDAPWDANLKHIVGCDFDTTTDVLRLYSDGLLRATAPVSEDKLSFQAGGVVFLGKRVPEEGNVLGFHGQMHEVVVTDAPTTDTLRQRICEYLATENGVAIA